MEATHFYKSEKFTLVPLGYGILSCYVDEKRPSKKLYQFSIKFARGKFL